MINLYDKIINDFSEFRPNIIGLNKSKYFDYTASGFDITKRPGWLRVSLHYSHLESEIDFLLNSIKELSTY